MSNLNLNLSELANCKEQKLLALILIELRILNMQIAEGVGRDLEETRSHIAYDANTPVIT